MEPPVQSTAASILAGRLGRASDGRPLAMGILAALQTGCCYCCALRYSAMDSGSYALAYDEIVVVVLSFLKNQAGLLQHVQEVEGQTSAPAACGGCRGILAGHAQAWAVAPSLASGSCSVLFNTGSDGAAGASGSGAGVNTAAGTSSGAGGGAGQGNGSAGPASGQQRSLDRALDRMRPGQGISQTLAKLAQELPASSAAFSSGDADGSGGAGASGTSAEGGISAAAAALSAVPRYARTEDWQALLVAQVCSGGYDLRDGIGLNIQVSDSLTVADHETRKVVAGRYWELLRLAQAQALAKGPDATSVVTPMAVDGVGAAAVDGAAEEVLANAQSSGAPAPGPVVCTTGPTGTALKLPYVPTDLKDAIKGRAVAVLTRIVYSVQVPNNGSADAGTGAGGGAAAGAAAAVDAAQTASSAAASNTPRPLVLSVEQADGALQQMVERPLPGSEHPVSAGHSVASAAAGEVAHLEHVAKRPRTAVAEADDDNDDRDGPDASRKGGLWSKVPLRLPIPYGYDARDVVDAGTNAVKEAHYRPVTPVSLPSTVQVALDTGTSRPITRVERSAAHAVAMGRAGASAGAQTGVDKKGTGVAGQKRQRPNETAALAPGAAASSGTAGAGATPADVPSAPVQTTAAWVHMGTCDTSARDASIATAISLGASGLPTVAEVSGAAQSQTTATASAAAAEGSSAASAVVARPSTTTQYRRLQLHTCSSLQLNIIVDVPGAVSNGSAGAGAAAPSAAAATAAGGEAAVASAAGSTTAPSWRPGGPSGAAKAGSAATGPAPAPAPAPAAAPVTTWTNRGATKASKAKAQAQAAKEAKAQQQQKGQGKGKAEAQSADPAVADAPAGESSGTSAADAPAIAEAATVTAAPSVEPSRDGDAAPVTSADSAPTGDATSVTAPEAAVSQAPPVEEQPLGAPAPATTAAPQPSLVSAGPAAPPPPAVPVIPATPQPALLTCSLARSSYFLSGRYIKLARGLSQTPWYVHGERRDTAIGDSSVEELVGGPVAALMAGHGGSGLPVGLLSADAAVSMAQGAPVASATLASAAVATQAQAQAQPAGLLLPLPCGPHPGSLAHAPRYKFHSAGREDVDVRMLGTGRPFVVELLDARPALLPLTYFGRAQNSINGFEEPAADGEALAGDSSTASAGAGSVVSQAAVATVARSEPKVLVRLLAPCTRQQFGHLQAGAESKRKRYVAVCWTSRHVTQSFLSARLHGLSDVQIAQQTPIRVLHRRSLMTRAKVLHKLQARLLVLPDSPLVRIEGATGAVVGSGSETAATGCAGTGAGTGTGANSKPIVMQPAGQGWEAGHPNRAVPLPLLGALPAGFVGSSPSVATVTGALVSAAAGAGAGAGASSAAPVATGAAMDVDGPRPTNAAAEPSSPFFLLSLNTSAGTYVKESVHGDLGRTKPSVAGLLGLHAADILSLDVVELVQQ